MESFGEPNWDEQNPHDVVKNSVPLTLVYREGENCKFFAENLDNVINHQYFAHGQELAGSLKFDQDSMTIVLPCSVDEEEKSRLHIWYIKTDAAHFGGKYKYFVSHWNDTLP